MIKTRNVSSSTSSVAATLPLSSLIIESSEQDSYINGDKKCHSPRSWKNDIRELSLNNSDGNNDNNGNNSQINPSEKVSLLPPPDSTFDINFIIRGIVNEVILINYFFQRHLLLLF